MEQHKTTQKIPQRNSSAELKVFFNYQYKIIGYLTFATIFLAGFAFIVMPQLQGYRSVKDVASFEKALNDISGVKKSLLETREDLKVLTPDVIAKLDLMLPQDKKIAELTLQIRSMIEMAGFKFSSISFQKEKAFSTEKGADGKPVDSAVKEISLSFTAEKGSYEGFQQLLTLLYQHRRLLNIKTVSFSAGETMDIAFQVSAFILP